MYLVALHCTRSRETMSVVCISANSILVGTGQVRCIVFLDFCIAGIKGASNKP